MTQSARPDWTASIASSGVFRATSVALGSARRAERSGVDPISTATLTEDLLRSAQVFASKPYFAMIVKVLFMIGRVNSTTSARDGVGLRPNMMSILLD